MNAIVNSFDLKGPSRFWKNFSIIASRLLYTYVKREEKYIFLNSSDIFLLGQLS